MSVLSEIKPIQVFKYFEEICSIPHGSQNCEKISKYCVDFAKSHGFRFIHDDADNVIIFKGGTAGYENREPVILQGHLDMVCQKNADCSIDFERDGLEIYTDGDFIRASGTTLGGDNGIAVAMILAILESDDIPHPPIEALFTTDEEIGMIGATALNVSPLRGKRLINIDSEEDDTVTVSCAGGADFSAFIKPEYAKKNGTKINITISGLKGGHSGIEINSGRLNANILLGRVLSHLNRRLEFDMISLNGGDKCNAITQNSRAELLTQDPDSFIRAAKHYLSVIKSEISAREPDFSYEVRVITNGGEYSVFSKDDQNRILNALCTAPNGVMEMSAEIEGLVETSLNLGILKTDDGGVNFGYALRSNKSSALDFLAERLDILFTGLGFTVSVSGAYPPWEFKSDSELLNLYKKCYTAQFGTAPKVEAIHAGLECGVFASKIKNLDCISIGPELNDVHTANESLSISSTANIYRLITEILKNC